MNRILLFSAIVLLAVLALVLLLRDGASTSPELISRPNVAQFATVTPTTGDGPQPKLPLPEAIWTEIQPSDVGRDNASTSTYLLELATGRMYAGTNVPHPHLQVFVGWNDKDETFISMQNGDFAYLEDGATFIGPLFGPMTRVPESDAQTSSRGIAAQDINGATTLFDTRTQRQVGTITDRPPGRLGGWSPDGRYLTFSTSATSRTERIDMTRIWDIEVGAVVAEVPSEYVQWSHQGNRFVYVVRPVENREDRAELRLSDAGRTSDMLVARGSDTAYWSPDDRFIISEGRDYLGGEAFAVSSYDVAKQKTVITLRGSWPMSWIGGHTLAVMGSVCGPSASYVIDADGSNFRQTASFSKWTVAHTSPTGDRIAYTSGGDYENYVVTVKDVANGRTREYATGGAWLPPHPGVWRQTWSPDGKYLVVMIPPGKGGPCEFDEPQTFELIRHP